GFEQPLRRQSSHACFPSVVSCSMRERPSRMTIDPCKTMLRRPALGALDGAPPSGIEFFAPAGAHGGFKPARDLKLATELRLVLPEACRQARQVRGPERGRLR